MTPQQLMNLPNYGAAQRAVKAMGKWEYTDTDRLDWLSEHDVMVHSGNKWLINYDVDFDSLRHQIDARMTQ